MASILDVLLNGTTGDAWSMALPNIKGQGREASFSCIGRVRHTNDTNQNRRNEKEMRKKTGSLDPHK